MADVMAKEQEKLICPACGCEIEGDPYLKDGASYCCEPCATGQGLCTCGCCGPEMEEEGEEKMRTVM